MSGDTPLDFDPSREAGVVLAGMGMPQAYGKLLGWLLICDPQAQSGAELVAALGLSKGSVSAGLRTTRDFYAFIETEMPKLIQRFQDEQRGRTDG
jgi:DNA-binding transcriptional regulator GbsR (MarR family)